MSIAEKLQTIAENEQKVYDAGKKVANEEFWASTPDFSTSYNFKYMLSGIVWNKNNFYPTKDIVVYSGQPADGMFQGHSQYSEPYDLSQRMADCGVILDFSGAIRVDYTFYQSWLIRLPKLDFSKASRVHYTFGYMPYLVTIDELIVPANATYTMPFTNAPELVNLIVGGVIGQNGFDVSPCAKLSHDSLMSIINALKDYSTDTSGTSHTVTLGATNLTKLTDAEKAIATEKGWTLL